MPSASRATQTTMNIVVREADSADAPLIADITRAAWAGKAAATSHGHLETVGHVLEHLQLGGACILMRDEQAVGSARWLPVESEPRVWEILGMGVLPQHRGERLSHHLLEAVIHHAQAADIDELRLAVGADQDRLLDLYAAFGFEPAPELEDAHAHPLEPVPTVMRRMLRY